MIISYLYVMCEFFKYHKGFLSRKKLFHYQIPCYYYCFQIDYPNPPGCYLYLVGKCSRQNKLTTLLYVQFQSKNFPGRKFPHIVI